MIELTEITIEHYNSIIETRNKVYRLALDLQMRVSEATRLATIVSEILRTLLNENRSTLVKLAFTKYLGCFTLHVFIAGNKSQYERFKKNPLFMELQYTRLENNKCFLDLGQKINDLKFKPNEDFLQTERERLIQQSAGEMLREIRQKNTELTKAIRDLKNSTSMIQAEKMRALGGMTAGVAHELNNPMMGILNYIQYAIKHTDNDDRKHKPLIDAECEVKRCINIISSLLTFSRIKAEGEEEFSEIKISVLFERILHILNHKLHTENIAVVRSFPIEEPAVQIKENGIQQVLLNLITNAIDAMNTAKRKELGLAINIYSKTIELIVSDTGIGIDEETQDKIFEPFFTTKKPGQGTGLGLAISLGIIEEAHGSLTCQSKVGMGTRFKIILPLKRSKHVYD